MNASGSTSNDDILPFTSSMNVLRYLNYQYIIIEAQGPTAFRNYKIALYLHLSYFIMLFLALLYIGNRKIMRSE